MLKYVRGGLETSRSSGAATVVRLLLELGDLTLGPPHLSPVTFGQRGHQPEAGEADAGERAAALTLRLLRRDRGGRGRRCGTARGRSWRRRARRRRTRGRRTWLERRPAGRARRR